MASMTPDFFNNLMFWKGKSQHNKSQQLNGLTKWDYTVNEIRKIIVWDNPIKSLACLAGVNLIFWLLISIKPKFYGLIFIALLVVIVSQLWNDYYHRSMRAFDSVSGRDAATPGSSDIRLSSLADENGCISTGMEMFRSGFTRLKRLRQEQPGTFCFATCVCFLIVSVVGRTISGVTLLYTLLTAIMIVPGVVIHLVPPQILNSFNQFICSSHKDSDVDKEEEDYMPETNNETLELLRLASDLQLIKKDEDEETRDLLLEQITGRTDDTSESSYSRLSLIPDSSIPGVEDSSLDFADFEITDDKHPKRRSSVEEDYSDGDVNFQRNLNEDSTDEEDFAKGLKFKDVVEKDDKITSETFPGLLNAVLSSGATLLSSAVKSNAAAATPVKRHERESSSDTDSFELISEEDI